VNLSPLESMKPLPNPCRAFCLLHQFYCIGGREHMNRTPCAHSGDNKLLEASCNFDKVLTVGDA